VFDVSVFDVLAFDVLVFDVLVFDVLSETMICPDECWNENLSSWSPTEYSPYNRKHVGCGAEEKEEVVDSHGMKIHSWADEPDIAESLLEEIQQGCSGYKWSVINSLVGVFSTIVEYDVHSAKDGSFGPESHV